nr:hypothetical protein CFP56_78829 [Quercus suber]POF10359.1 hypothetical protein CFP56_46223 [Quercus suber]POF10360.1 hypothetical protein CFP56_46224 [Quercus suber]
MATSDVSWGILFGFGIWTLRTHRNGVLFPNERNQSDLKYEVLAKANEFAYIGINGKLTISHRIIRVSWLKPPMSWYKLNLDGLLLGNLGRAGGGGLIHND